MANMKKPTGKVKLTPAQVAAKVAAEKKALEAYRKSRPSKDQVAKVRERQAAKAAADQKVVDRINAQTRTNRSKTVAPKPATRRPGTAKPAPLGTPAPRTQRVTPAPLGTPSAKPTGRRPAMPKTTKKSPEKMTPQDAAMKKILEKRYGKIYG